MEIEKAYHLYGIPEEVHKEFKIKCIRLGKDMRERIIELMQEDIKND